MCSAHIPAVGQGRGIYPAGRLALQIDAWEFQGPFARAATALDRYGAGRGNSSDTRLPSLARKRRAVAPDGSLPLSERERVRASAVSSAERGRVRFDSTETVKHQ